MATKDELAAELEQVAADAEEANNKADALIEANVAVKAQVVDLQKQIDDLKASGGATAADLDGLLATAKKIDDSIKTQIGEDDAALGG